MSNLLVDAFKKAGQQPAKDAASKEKKNFAERLSRALAIAIANALRPDFKEILPGPDGKGQESKARSAKGYKKLDVNYSTPQLGLGLGVSIKTLNYRDAKSGRYTKNYTRIDNELRAEATDYHQRQPYAVMVAIIFLPVDSCDDARKKESSFGSVVKHFRNRANRVTHKDECDLFERVFIGLYEIVGTELVDVFFFDVMTAPPKSGRPRSGRLSFDMLVSEIKKTYDDRNDPPFEWA